MEAVDGRELSQLDALERLDGPQGQDRLDWCFAWLASWWVEKRDESTVTQLWAHLIHTLRGKQDQEEHELIADPELSRQKAAEIGAQLERILPRKPKDS